MSRWQFRLPAILPWPPYSQAFTPSTLPPTVPSNGGCGSPSVVEVVVWVVLAAAARAFSHSSGVWHLALQAWMAAISSRSAALTARWRFRLFWPAKTGDTTSDVKDWPQPPVCFRGVCKSVFVRGSLVRDEERTLGKGGIG